MLQVSNPCRAICMEEQLLNAHRVATLTAALHKWDLHLTPAQHVIVTERPGQVDLQQTDDDNMEPLLVFGPDPNIEAMRIRGQLDYQIASQQREQLAQLQQPTPQQQMGASHRVFTPHLSSSPIPLRQHAAHVDTIPLQASPQPAQPAQSEPARTLGDVMQEQGIFPLGSPFKYASAATQNAYCRLRPDQRCTADMAVTLGVEPHKAISIAVATAQAEAQKAATPTAHTSLASRMGATPFQQHQPPQQLPQQAQLQQPVPATGTRMPSSTPLRASAPSYQQQVLHNHYDRMAGRPSVGFNLGSQYARSQTAASPLQQQYQPPQGPPFATPVALSSGPGVGMPAYMQYQQLPAYPQPLFFQSSPAATGSTAMPRVPVNDVAPTQQQLKAVRSSNTARPDTYAAEKDVNRIVAARNYMQSFDLWTVTNGIEQFAADTYFYWEVTPPAPGQASQSATGFSNICSFTPRFPPTQYRYTENQRLYMEYERAAGMWAWQRVMESVKGNIEMSGIMRLNPAPLLTPFLTQVKKTFAEGAPATRARLVALLRNRKQGQKESYDQFHIAFMAIVNDLIALGYEIHWSEWIEVFIANLRMTEVQMGSLAAQRVAHPDRLRAPEEIVLWLTSIQAQVESQQVMRGSSSTQGYKGGAVNHLIGHPGLEPEDAPADTSANSSQTQSKGKGKCKLCGSPDHWAADCDAPQDSSRGKSRRTGRGKGGRKSRSRSRERKDGQSDEVCPHCNLKGHDKQNCWQLHPRLAPEGWAEQRQKREASRKKKALEKEKNAQTISTQPAGSAVFMLSTHAPSLEEDTTNQHVHAAPSITESDPVQRLLSGQSELKIPVQARATAQHATLSGRGIIVFLDSGSDATVAPPSVPLTFCQQMKGGAIHTAGSDVLRDPTMGMLNLGRDSKGEDVFLRVLRHPGLRVMLVSVSQLNAIPDVDRIDFTDDCATVWSKHGPILRAPQKDGQYQTTLADLVRMLDLMHINEDGTPAAHSPAASSSYSASAHTAAATGEQEAAAHRWHLILGHPRAKATQKLLKPSQREEPAVAGRGLTLSAAQWDGCSTCATAKQARRPFHPTHGKKRAAEPLDWVSADLMGPMKHPTYQGGLYILLIKDEFSGRLWTSVLRGKDDAAGEVIRWAKSQFVKKQRYPRVFHTDRGTEFLNSTLFNFWSSVGTRMSSTLAYTPQQNGAVERENRSVIEMVRTLLITSGAPRTLWGHAIYHCAMLINMTRADARGLVPVVKYDAVKPPVSLDQLHPWGCTAIVNYSRGEASRRDKLDPVAREVVYVGRAGGGFRFATAEKGSLDTLDSRDCTFRDLDFSAAHRLSKDIQHTELAADFGNELYTEDGEYLRALEESRMLAERLAQLQAEQGLEASLTPTPGSPPPDSDSSTDAPADDELTKAAPTRRRSVSFQDERTQGSSDEEEYLPHSARPAAAPAAGHRRSSRSRAPPFRYGLVDERDFGGGSAMEAQLQRAEEYLTASLFTDEDSDTESEEEVDEEKYERPQPAVSPEEQTRLKNLLLFEENQDIAEEDLTPCNRKGERITPTQRCAAYNAKGKSCGNKTRIGCFCYTHMRQLLGLRVSKSGIAGMGLYTAIPRSKGDTITKYTGDRISGNTDPDFKGSMYVFQVDKQTFIDAARKNAALGRFANSPKGGHRSNLKWVINHRDKTVRLVATRSIAAGEELLIQYGGGYWGTLRRGEHLPKNERKKAAPALPAPKAAAQKRPALKQPPIVTAPQRQLGRGFKQPTLAAHNYTFHAYGAATSRPSLLQAQNDEDAVEPRTYEEAMASPQREQWQAAMDEEKQTLDANGTFTPLYRELPPHVALLGLKWVFKLKRDETGKIARYKARLVARGFAQRPEDYDNTHSPTLSQLALRVIVALAALKGWRLTQADFTGAYLNPTLDKNVLVRVPRGYSQYAAASALQLNKGLYGLHQSGALWYFVLIDAMLELGYKPQMHGEQCVLVRKLSSGRELVAGLYVDDLLIAHDERDQATVDADLAALGRKYKLKVLGLAKFVLGIELQYLPGGAIKMTQATYLRRILTERGYADCRIERTPASTGQLTSAKSEEKLAKEGSQEASAASSSSASTLASRINADTYKSVLGSLMYAANCTRPDIAQALNTLAREAANPSAEAVLGLRRVARYLRGTLSIGLTFAPEPAGSSQLVAYSDSDWAGCLVTRRSTTGSVLTLAGAAVYWASKRQPTVTLSTAEAEYVAMGETARSVIYCRELLKHVGLPQARATPLLCDSQAAIAISGADSVAPRRKHIDVKHHYVREKIEAGAIEVQWISTVAQPADILTKPLPYASFIQHRLTITNTEPAADGSEAGDEADSLVDQQ